MALLEFVLCGRGRNRRGPTCCCPDHLSNLSLSHLPFPTLTSVFCIFHRRHVDRLQQRRRLRDSTRVPSVRSISTQHHSYIYLFRLFICYLRLKYHYEHRCKYAFCIVLIALCKDGYRSSLPIEKHYIIYIYIHVLLLIKKLEWFYFIFYFASAICVYYTRVLPIGSFFLSNTRKLANGKMYYVFAYMYVTSAKI